MGGFYLVSDQTHHDYDDVVDVFDDAHYGYLVLNVNRTHFISQFVTTNLGPEQDRVVDELTLRARFWFDEVRQSIVRIDDCLLLVMWFFQPYNNISTKL